VPVDTFVETQGPKFGESYFRAQEPAPESARLNLVQKAVSQLIRGQVRDGRSKGEVERRLTGNLPHGLQQAAFERSSRNAALSLDPVQKTLAGRHFLRLIAGVRHNRPAQARDDLLQVYAPHHLAIEAIQREYALRQPGVHLRHQVAAGARCGSRQSKLVRLSTAGRAE